VVFDCCLLSPNYVDENLFQSWIRGEEAMKAYNTACSNRGTEEQQSLAAIKDQWLVHEGLQHYLQRPWLLNTQKLHPISSESHGRSLIQAYYSFNGEVARKLMGWKLEGSKSLARLESISKETQEQDYESMKKSATRQFHNFARVLKTVKVQYSATAKLSAEPSMRDLISGRYKMPRSLANSYAQIIFASEHRLELSRSPNLENINFVTVCKMVSVVSSRWTAPEGSLILDRQWLDLLVAIKEGIEGDWSVTERFTFDRANSAAILKMEAIADPKRRKDFVEGCYKQVLQCALTIAGNLNNNIRTLFVETIDKICVPLSRIEATSTEVAALFEHIKQLVGGEDTNQLVEVLDQTHQQAWHRYVDSLHRMASLLINEIGDLGPGMV